VNGPQRIHVVGATGTGKTTFADRLSGILGVRHVELDELHWLQEWTPEEPARLDEKVRRVASGDRWVVDGNYSQVQPILWERADTVVWLDYSFPRMFGRLLLRTGRRIISREPLWNDNRESLRSAVGRDSILWWQVKTYRKHRRTYPARFAHPRWSHLETVRLRTPAEADRWLAKLSGTPAP
jgi:adenylate kinase family enzyme